VDSAYFCGGERNAAPKQSQASAFEELDDSDGELPWKDDDDDGLPL
jgi:hypothetical protein